MSNETVDSICTVREPLKVINSSGQAVFIGKSVSNASMSTDPVVLLAARRKAHEKAVEAIMEHRKQLLRGDYIF